jgi:cytochrome c oxidase assembly protein subunit 15
LARLTPFQRLAIATTALTYVLIAVGGLVRASGAGLGCPDWPRCFGSWIPPVSVADLPPEFDRAQFNPTLMWTEYLNRVLGMSVGFAILATAVSAWRRHRREPRILWPVVAALLLTGYEGWLGGRVVAHELAPWIVTAHLVVALVIVQLLLWATVESLVGDPTARRGSRYGLAPLGWGAWAATALLLLQVGVGTQVRGRVDTALATLPRAEALASVGTLDTTHRELAGLVVLAVVALWASVWLRHAAHRPLRRAVDAALAATVVQVLAGVALAGLALPPIAQVTHLTVSAILLGALTAVGLIAWRWPAPADGAADRARAAARSSPTRTFSRSSVSRWSSWPRRDRPPPSSSATRSTAAAVPACSQRSAPPAQM